MKWSELTLKERKQIYDKVRADNPNSTYFDIKNQFDSIPAYEDGNKSWIDWKFKNFDKEIESAKVKLNNQYGRLISSIPDTILQRRRYTH